MGYTAEVVERWIPRTKTRRDLFGCIDIVAVHEYHGILGVQATTTGNMSARIKKSMAEPRLYAWLLAGGKFAVWGWAKRGPRGKRKLWTLSQKRITLVCNIMQVEMEGK